MRRPFMQFAAPAIILSALSAVPARAESACKDGYYHYGEKVERVGNTDYVHPLCRRLRSVRPGEPFRPQSAGKFRKVGNGLIGGTAWQLGYYVPEGASPEVVAHARKMVREQAARAGAAYDEAVDFERYRFVIGIANETVIWRDLVGRVLFEQFMNGQYTARPGYQAAYNSIKGRQFGELGCHSNGAMICLAALANDEVRADDVVLYGPQITVESLELWKGLVEIGRIRSLRIEINANDPVPPAALLFSPDLTIEERKQLALPLLFQVDSVRNGIKAIVPHANVRTHACGSLPTLDCHDMRKYKRRGP